MRTDIVLIIATAVTLLSQAVGADDTGKSEGTVAEQANRAFVKGNDHFRRSEFAEAAEAYCLANSLRPNWKLLYNLAQSEAAAKRYGLAIEAFEAYLVQGGDEVSEERRRTIIKEVEQFRSLVGSVEITAQNGAEITIDGVLRGTAPLLGPLLIAAGVEHRVTVRFEDVIIGEQQIKISGGMQRKLDFEAVAEAKPLSDTAPTTAKETISAPTASPAPKKRSKMFITGLTLTVAGGAALIATAVTGALALSLNNELVSDCGGTVCPQEKAEDNERLDNLVLSTNVLLGVGGAFAVAGVVLTVIGGKKRNRTERVSLQPLIGPDVAGCNLSWRF